MGALSDTQVGVGTSVEAQVDLTATVSNSLKGGDLAYVTFDSNTEAGHGYWAFVPWSTTGLVVDQVILADVGSDAPPKRPGRWFLLNIAGVTPIPTP